MIIKQTSTMCKRKTDGEKTNQHGPSKALRMNVYIKRKERDREENEKKKYDCIICTYYNKNVVCVLELQFYFILYYMIFFQ